jgi:hypothetical protein
MADIASGRVLVATIDCPEYRDCPGPVHVYKGDRRSGSWLRFECAANREHWGDIKPTSPLLRKERARG